jgi:hypothetical protein
MRFKEIIREQERVIEREFDGNTQEIIELIDYLIESEDACIEFDENDWRI